MCPGEINTAGKSQVTEPLPCPCAGHSRLWGAPLPVLREIQCDLIPLFRPFHAVPPCALSCVPPLPWAKRGVLLAGRWWGAPWRNLPAPAAPAEWAELGFPFLCLQPMPDAVPLSGTTWLRTLACTQYPLIHCACLCGRLLQASWATLAQDQEEHR